MIWPPASAGDAHAAAAAISAQQLNENRGIAPSRLPKLPFVQYFLACHIILVSCPSRRSIYLTPLDPREPAPPAPPSPRRRPRAASPRTPPISRRAGTPLRATPLRCRCAA